MKTIVLVLRSGGDFSMRDVELISRHINMKWESVVRPRILCLWDKATEEYDMGNVHIMPLGNTEPGTWARIALYSPRMEQYRPFLYLDLDTAVIDSVEGIFDLVQDPSKFIALEDFWQRGQLATAVVWFPAQSEKIQAVWNAYQKGVEKGWRMDYFLRKVITADTFWQRLSRTVIVDFKPNQNTLLQTVPHGTVLVCFHGKPRIFQAAEASMYIKWVRDYVDQQTATAQTRASVIISYKQDRGWLQEAIDSVQEEWAEVILIQTDEIWTVGMNAGIEKAKGQYIKYLHEDDKLVPGGLDASIHAMESAGADFVHGAVYELMQSTGNMKLWVPKIFIPTLEDMLKTNIMHSASMLYRKSVFERVGLFNPTIDSSEDYEFNLRCLSAGLSVAYCPTPVSVYRRHPAQKVRTFDKTHQDEVRQIIKRKYTNV